MKLFAIYDKDNGVMLQVAPPSSRTLLLFKSERAGKEWIESNLSSLNKTKFTVEEVFLERRKVLT